MNETEVSPTLRGFISNALAKTLEIKQFLGIGSVESEKRPEPSDIILKAMDSMREINLDLEDILKALKPLGSK